MKDKKNFLMGILALIGMLLLILDTETAVSGARDGLELCLSVLIPSLFPFFILSTIVSSMLIGKRILILKPLCKLCGIPDGGESLFLLGLAGGYPVGARAIADAHENGQLTAKDAHRLLGFCSNAGPAFIFGMAGSFFDSSFVPWCIWAVHIASAILTGILLPDKNCSKCRLDSEKPITVTAALTKSLHAMASVCGWVVLFRVIYNFLNKWLLCHFPAETRIILTGLLELSNGITALADIHNQSSRFIICTCLLGFGGLCVWMQTISVTKKMGTGMYLPGKLLQCFLSLFLSVLVQYFIFPKETQFTISAGFWAGAVTFGVLLTFFVRKRTVKSKKVVAIYE